VDVPKIDRSAVPRFRRADGTFEPAAYGMTVCRYHGARKPDAIRKGSNHPQYRHGRETLEAKAERSKVLAELREIEALSFAYGLVPKGTPRWRGRKPKG
jgi:hypothetical protein